MHELPDRIKDRFELSIVLALQSIEFPRQILVGCQELADPDKGIHNLDIDLDRSFAVKDAGEHGYTLLCKSVRRVSSTTPLS